MFAALDELDDGAAKLSIPSQVATRHKPTPAETRELRMGLELRRFDI